MCKSPALVVRLVMRCPGFVLEGVKTVTEGRNLTSCEHGAGRMHLWLKMICWQSRGYWRGQRLHTETALLYCIIFYCYSVISCKP